MVFLTGDLHGGFSRLTTKHFPEQKEMTRDDFVICLGDCAITWNNSYILTEKYLIDWFKSKNFTFCYVTGNHEGYDRLKTYPIVDFHGGKAIQLGENVFCLKRGEIFDFCGKKFFAFGGAQSHDIDGGVFEPDDKEGIKRAMVEWENRTGGHFRVNHESWWAEEMPSDEEMENGLKNLEKNNWTVDYIISHDIAASVLAMQYRCPIELNKLNRYFNDLVDKVNFKHWWCGHHHVEQDIMGKFHITYEKITRVI